MLAGSAAGLAGAEPQKEDAIIAQKLITAIESSDYDAFVVNGEAAFKQLKKEQFDAVASQLAPKLKAGHELSYLGDLKQKGCHVTLWRVRFAGGGDDALATLVMREGKISGFWIR